MITKEETNAINGSELFFFKTKLSEENQLKILAWYRNLHQWERDFVDTLIKEGKEDAEFFKPHD